MKITQLITIKDGNYNGGYVSLSDNNKYVDRILSITDDDGHTVIIKNEQIGELYRSIKPGLAG